MGQKIIETDKLILDACCGGRMMWFNKAHPDVLYIDNRSCLPGHIKRRPNHSVEPDIIADFRNLPFKDKQFKHIAWDPPHLKTLTMTSVMGKKFGQLNTETWPYDLGKGFDELWRVLDDYGTLIFKWAESEISLKQVLSCFKEECLYGNPMSKGNKGVIWLSFFKSPKGKRKK